MASAKKGDSKDISQDISQYLPEGFNAEEFATVGGLRPLVTPEIQFENKVPVMGYLLGWVAMPERPKDKSQWDAIIMKTIAPTKALVGTEIKDIEIGTDVLIPVGGNLGNNQDLFGAATDPKEASIAILTVTGQVEIGRPSPMWAYDVKIHKKKVARDHKLALIEAISPSTKNSAGQMPAQSQAQA